MKQWNFVAAVILCGAAVFSVQSPSQAASPSSVYRGQWNSGSTGHQGPMRVRLTQRGDGQVDARFTGRFAVVIPFTYKVTMTPVACDNCGTQYVASKKLGPILGSYQMSAHVTPSGLNGSFSAAGDVGTVMMRRVR